MSRPRPRRTKFGLLLAAWLAVAAAGCGGATATGGSPAPGVDSGASAGAFDRGGWRTDFARHSVPLGTISAGGPPRDGIPPIDRPKFTTTAEAARVVGSQEPVIAVVIGGRARAYPLAILLWHEIVNDTIGRQPIAVTYCPLCNTAIVFNRRSAGMLLTFGTTGNLRNSDLVMWDRQTQSWWQQFDGHAIVGALTGGQLVPLDSETLSFADFRGRYPGGEVLSRDTGFERPYGQTPYAGYDASGQRPFLYRGKPDPRLPALARVEVVTAGSATVVLPFDALSRHPATAITITGTPAIVVFQPSVRSPLDAKQLDASRAVGAAAAFDRRVPGRTLEFRAASAGAMTDVQTHSLWDVTGRAVDGPLRGTQLHRLRDLQAFWFAVAAFLPDAQIVKSPTS